VAAIPSTVAEFRARYRETEIGPRYRGWAHFAFTTLTSLGVIALALARVHRASLAEWCTVPGAFLFANVAEYFGHKGPMHHRRPGLGLLFRRHTLQHHRFFTHDVMAYESSRDFKMVLFPPIMIVFFLGALAVPIGALLFWAASANVGWLFVATAMAYYLTYEWCHFAYHLGDGHPVGALPLVRRLRRHHQTHHDPERMGRVNFNITFPICDWIFGTMAAPLSADARSSGAPADPGVPPRAGSPG
jgi:fatty acid hydroxylase family protein